MVLDNFKNTSMRCAYDPLSFYKLNFFSYGGEYEEYLKGSLSCVPPLLDNALTIGVQYGDPRIFAGFVI